MVCRRERESRYSSRLPLMVETIHSNNNSICFDIGRRCLSDLCYYSPFDLLTTVAVCLTDELIDVLVAVDVLVFVPLLLH